MEEDKELLLEMEHLLKTNINGDGPHALWTNGWGEVIVIADDVSIKKALEVIHGVCDLFGIDEEDVSGGVLPTSMLDSIRSKGDYYYVEG